MADLVETHADVSNMSRPLRLLLGRIHSLQATSNLAGYRETIDIRRHVIRRSVYNSVSKVYQHLSLDVGFTMDRRWALSSVHAEEHDVVVVPPDNPKVDPQ